MLILLHMIDVISLAVSDPVLCVDIDAFIERLSCGGPLCHAFFFGTSSIGSHVISMCLGIFLRDGTMSTLVRLEGASD